MVDCPICSQSVKESNINRHIDSDCKAYVESSETQPLSPAQQHGASQKPQQVSSFFNTASAKKKTVSSNPAQKQPPPSPSIDPFSTQVSSATPGSKRPAENQETALTSSTDSTSLLEAEPLAKRPKASNALQKVAPLAERMRPRTLDEVCGQDIVGPNGVLRGLILADKVPSLILWGGTGTGKTTIARVIAQVTGSRFIEINATSSGIQECKKIFAEAKSDLNLTGRRTIIFCDEIHRFSKTQQDVFLGPVESGQVCLIAATTENRLRPLPFSRDYVSF